MDDPTPVCQHIVNILYVCGNGILHSEIQSDGTVIVTVSNTICPDQCLHDPQSGHGVESGMTQQPDCAQNAAIRPKSGHLRHSDDP